MNHDIGVFTRRRIVSPGESYFAAPAAGGYVGPGDITAFTAWLGLRAYTAAYAAAQSACIDLTSTNNALTNVTTINVTTTGAIDTAAITSYIGTFGAAFVSKMYDQTGNGHHAARAVLTIPTINVSPLGILGDGTTRSELISDSFAINQPYGVCCVGLSNVGTSDTSGFFGLPGSDGKGEVRATDLFGIFAGGAAPTFDFISATGMTTSAHHAIQCIFNGASSVVNVDGGTDATGNPGAGTGAAGFYLIYDNSRMLNGVFREYGLIAGATSNNTSVRANMKTYWGIA